MAQELLNEIIDRVQSMSPDQQDDLVEAVEEWTRDKPFVPNPGPQTDAYYSEADVLLFGGNPGGGKTANGIGLALNEHFRSLIVRLSFSDLEGITDTAKKLVGSSRGFVGGARPKYRKPDGGVIHFAGVSADGGIGGHQGVDHDLLYIDEAAQFPEAQIRLLMGWLRTDRPGQRTRVVMGSNPPLDTTGDWLVPYFAPWLDPTHPNPAENGELRYFLPDDNGKDRECEKGDSIEIGGEKVYAQSRTFIPSKFTDNPYYDAEEYAKTLAGLPVEVREILVTGNFMLGRKDTPWQAIPTAWVQKSMNDRPDRAPNGVPMCGMGVDVAGGGADDVVLAPRWDGWFGDLVVEPGRDFPNGKGIGGLVITHLRDRATVILDMGGGYGSLPYDQLKENGVDILAYKGAEKSLHRTTDGKLKFTNKRTEAYWMLREALDPEQPGGQRVFLPDDRELLSDLTSPLYEVNSQGIKLETKVHLVKRLGRSPNKGDAVVMAWYDGAKALSHRRQWEEQGIGRSGSRTPQVIRKRK